ncbi:hypothetical protein [Arthrobacter sp. YAF16]|uniref:hypothetical protein n=1 Tax=Arthrobacter sp. YAF16 TaxID=3233076 RepID=UPI003F91F7C7
MNHKLRVLVRVDVDPGHVTLEVTGCLTQANYPALLHIMRRASRLASGSDVSIDLHGASHLDPEILLYLRQLAANQAPAAPQEPVAAAVGLAAGGSEGFRLLLQEPAELPICLVHVGSDGEVLAGLDGEITGAVTGQLLGEVADLDIEGHTPDDAGSAAAPGPDLIDGLELSDYFEGTLDPAATVQALSDAALGQLADALYRHLDTPSPSFGAHTWYELAAEELQQRYRAMDEAELDGAALDVAGPVGAALDSAPDGPAEGELAPGPALA